MTKRRRRPPESYVFKGGFGNSLVSLEDALLEFKYDFLPQPTRFDDGAVRGSWLELEVGAPMTFIAAPQERSLTATFQTRELSRAARARQRPRGDSRAILWHVDGPGE